MKKISTLLTSLFVFTLLLTSCGDKETVDPQDCNVVKEFLVSQGNRQLLNQYHYNESGKIVKIAHEDANGKPYESQFEYDSNGRLIKITDKLTNSVTGEVFMGTLEYLYTSEGNLFQIDAYNTENDQRTLFQQLSIYQDNATNRIVQVNTSFADSYRFEYNEAGNATKSFYKASDKAEYLIEEYTAYNDKVQDAQEDEPFLLRNLYFSLRGRSFAHNQVTAYKVYNPDGSLKETLAINREYDTAGKVVKETTTSTTNGATASTTLEKVYPSCK